MANEEYGSLFNSLSEMLTTNGMNWVVLQANSQIQLGKSIQKEVETLSLESIGHSTQPGLFQDIPTYRKGRKAKFTATVEYSPKEQLLLLIDAIEHSIADVADIAIEFYNTIDQEADGLREIVFVSENGADNVRLTRENITTQSHISNQLRQVLNDLRSEID